MDFFWINRHHRAFEWFVNLLSQLELEQTELGGPLEEFLRLHLYVTSAPAGDDFRSLLLQVINCQQTPPILNNYTVFNLYIL